MRSQLDLLQLYWGERVATGPEMYGRLAVLEKLAREMIRQRRDRLHPAPRRTSPTVTWLPSMGCSATESCERTSLRGMRRTSAPVAFAHALLFDFTVASQVLARPEEPMCLAGGSRRGA